MSMYGRSTGRDVHIYSAKDTNTVLGGLRLTDSITKANFYSMVEIVFIFDNDYTLCSESGTTVKRDDNPLQPGKYLIRTVGSLMVNNEPWLARTGNVPPETSNPEFRHAVRKRDRGCVITGQRAIYGAHGFWTAYKATRIFPLEHTEHWVNHGYDRWITTATSGASINSVQNGVLLRLDIRALFEVYLVSINPDDNYKIVCFAWDDADIGGRHLDKTFIEDPQRPCDQLLRWHFRQAVLANMRGQGEPILDLDFPPDSDTDDEL